MARIRTIKPEFFRHEELFAAEKETGFPLRVAYAGLWTAADREGRFRWAPKQLKLDCLPYDDIDFSRVLDALVTRGFIVRYASEGREFGAIPSWREHQVINNREKASTIPEYNEINDLTRATRVRLACPTPLVQVTGEGKGKEGKGSKTADAALAVKEYEFDGGVIRLSGKHFEDWSKAFGNLDLLSELTARDAWLGSSRATDADRGNWFISTSKYLANRNMEARAKSAPSKRALSPFGTEYPDGII